MPTTSGMKELYQEFFASFQLADSLALRCSAPLLISPTPQWSTANLKLLVVGQETLGWGAATSGHEEPPITDLAEFLAAPRGVERLMTTYEEFSFGEHYHGRNSPFWRAFRHLTSNPNTTALWSNAFRFDLDGGSVLQNSSEADLHNIHQAQRGLLNQEITMLSPDVVLFLTGPNYDATLSNEFPDITFHAVAGRTARQFARTNSADLPAKSYRLYHPAYLNRDKTRSAWLDELIDARFDLQPE